MGATSSMGVGGSGPRVMPAEVLFGDAAKWELSCWFPQKEVVQP